MEILYSVEYSKGPGPRKEIEKEYPAGSVVPMLYLPKLKKNLYYIYLNFRFCSLTMHYF